MTAAPFFYTEEASGNWAEHLNGLVQRGTRTIRAPILWGAHEQFQGTRDFSRSSRLRLEKFLRLVAESGLKLELAFGFPSVKEAVPAWALSAGYLSTLLPTSGWKGDAAEVSLTRVPSLFDVDFQEAFLDFVSDAMGIVGLYAEPEGPVSSIVIDPGIYEADLGVIESPYYVEKLQQRYPTIAPFNTHYRTTFKDFIAATSAQGTRAIFDKRPWLAAYDYKWCRAKMLSEFAEKLVQLPCFAEHRALLRFDESTPSKSAPSDWSLAFDPVMLETTAGGCYPFTPGGLLQPQATGAFRLWDYLSARAQTDGIALQFLPPAPGAHDLSGKLLTVVAGKYLSRSSFRLIDEWVSAGGQAYFPLDFPQYDETMGGLDWRAPTERKQVKTSAGVFTRIRRGEGFLWVPGEFLGLRQDLWSRMRATSEIFLSPELA